MKIYTKGGDKGTTSLLGGKRVSKASLRIDTYGTIDELNVYVGMVRDIVADESTRNLLEQIQIQLFTFGAYLAADPDKKSLKLPAIDKNQVGKLETAIDFMEGELIALKNFILPGGHLHVSSCHLARVNCRKAERMVVALDQAASVNPYIVIYLNRLSDFFFVLSRKIAAELNIEELPWKQKN